MIGWHFAEDLHVGRICRVMHVGPCTAHVLLDVPRCVGEPLSGETLRLAEELASTTQTVEAGRVRVASLLPSGRPVATVEGVAADFFVSTSHVGGLLGAAVSSHAQVGLDIVDPAEAGRVLDIWFTPDELALLPDDHGLLRAMLWSAKEAAYKAARLDTEFRPRMVVIESLSANAFEWRLRDGHATVHGAGCFATVGRYVVALAAAPSRCAESGGEIVDSAGSQRWLLDRMGSDAVEPFTEPASVNHQGVSA